MARDKRQRGKSARPLPPALKTAPPSAVPRLHVALIAAAIVLASWAAFWGLHSSGFILFDDDAYVRENAHVRKGLGGESIAWAFTSTEAANWHPLTWLSHMLDVRLFGLDAGKHHLTSLLLHTVNAVLLFLLLIRMTGALWRSAFVAALFALHPLHVESVAWIAERKDVLSTLFWLLTTGAWLAYVKSSKTVPYALTLMFFALGLMAKPMLVTLPFTLLLLDYWPLRRLEFPLSGNRGVMKGLVLEKAPLFVMSAASCVVTVIAQRGGGAVKTMTAFPLGQRLANAAHAYAVYVIKTFWPSPLAVFYPHPHFNHVLGVTAGSALLLLGVTALALWLAKTVPYLLFGWLWYLGTLVPVIGLVQVGDQGMADRYTYIPLIGLFIAVAWGSAAVGRENRALRHAVPAAAAVSLAALFLLTRAQTGTWADSEALFGHALAVTSDNALAHNGFGLVLYAKGGTTDAVAQYREALRIDPDYPDAHNNLGIALAAEGHLTEAVAQYQQALRADPDAVKILNNLGVALARLNRWPEAAACLERAVRLSPEFAGAQGNLGNALAGAGRLEEAVDHYRLALRLQPDSFTLLNNLGLALKKMNRMPEAIACFLSAVRIHPDYGDARNNLGMTLAETGRTTEAIEQFQQALRLQPGSAKTLDNLGLALGKANRFPEALECFRRAVEADPHLAEAHGHLGIGLVQAHRLGEARDQFEQALRLKPDFALARTELDHVLNALRGERSSDVGLYKGLP